ncbi:MAG: M48 family metallopeptidase [Planctomycetia bacterium]|nr:MAG: M48 family metallopeptidase [Planctomycetia bacterium]
MTQKAQTAPETHEIRFGSERILCSLVRSSLSRLRLEVAPTLLVTIRAPAHCSTPQALAWARRRANWILQQQDYFREFLPRPRAKQYVNGESFRYLGRQYRLKIGEGKPQHVAIRDGFLRVTALDRQDAPGVKRLIEEWYRRRSLDVFEGRLDMCFRTAKLHGIPRPNLKRRRMLRRWGSCRVGKAILLNTYLVMAPVHCIDYVIMHELCHLKVSNHGASFCRLLGQLMPDWKIRKTRLERIAVL